MHVLSATNPCWQNAEHTLLNLTAQFEHLPVPVPFTAAPDDPEPYGRWLFAMARDGEFGPVAEYVPPTPLEVATRENPQTRQDAMTLATTNSQHFEMMGNTEQAAAWRIYYRELYALTSTPEWPLVEQWPVAPELAA